MVLLTSDVLEAHACVKSGGCEALAGGDDEGSRGCVLRPDSKEPATFEDIFGDVGR